MKKREMVQILLEIIEESHGGLEPYRCLDDCNCEACQAVRQARAYVEGKK